jgi:hypothetical protein
VLYKSRGYQSAVDDLVARSFRYLSGIWGEGKEAFIVENRGTTNIKRRLDTRRTEGNGGDPTVESQEGHSRGMCFEVVGRQNLKIGTRQCFHPIQDMWK